MGKEPTFAAAPAVTGRRKVSSRRISSRYFNISSKAHDCTSGHAAQLPKALGVQGAWRSDYFVSSPDSSSGSASTFDWGSAFTERAFRAFKACELFESFGVRHICTELCYLRAYEPARKWHALRIAVARAGASTKVLSGWSVRMDGGAEAGHSWRIDYVSPDGSVFPSAKPVLVALGLTQSGVADRSTSPSSVRRKRRTSTALPQTVVVSEIPNCSPDGPAYLMKNPRARTFPPSPFGLIEELLTDDPWKLLIGCIMLNQTTRSQMDPVLVRFLEKFPSAEVAAAATIEEMTHVVAPLGLQERRPIAIIRFSQEYLSKSWKKPEELYWVGKYAADAHKIFIERKWRQVQPSDHALQWWVEWMRGTPQPEE
ncbi:unnamed protein product, partial [Hapterophycus canaliculatus]